MRWVRVVAGVAAVVGFLWLIVVLAPPWFVDNDSLEGLKAQNEVRTTLLQGVAGTVLLVGVYFTWRQLHTAREGQITERYTRAIDQLGHSEVDVRLGGIYALERIARDSPADKSTIGEVLSAFVRNHAPWPPRLPGQYEGGADIDQVPELEVRTPDVQATLTVLGRGGYAPPAREGDPWLVITPADLRKATLSHGRLEGANLSGAHLEGANLMEAHLEGADLMDAHLERANLVGAYLRGARLSQAHLERAYLIGAHLESANLAGAHLEGANLMNAHLERAFLTRTHLEVANLIGAHLERANLTDAHLWRAYLMVACLEGANLTDAHLEEARALKTVWPAGFDWRGAGVIMWGEDDTADSS
jgi:uncharacterized protein YjbI with pentapeptide repeats